MPKRKFPLVNGKCYHIFSKSIAGFKIFRNNSEYKRMSNLFRYYKIDKLPIKFSAFMQIKRKRKKEEFYNKYLVKEKSLIEIIAYCLMPTHIHLILKQRRENGISAFMGSILNSYTHYFNLKTERKGPLWESRFQNVRVETDEQLLHLTRYIHLNPVTVHLANKPQDWKFSSYLEFLGEVNEKSKICNFSAVLDIKPHIYRKFVNSNIDYQRKLSKMKKLFLD